MIRLNRMDAYRFYLIYVSLLSLVGSIVFTTWMVFQIQVAGLTPLQLVLVGTVMEATIFIFEIPTGIVADVYSRRLSIIIGFVLVGAAYILQSVAPSFAVILIGQVIWGLGYTFTSGADRAWIVDEVGEEGIGQVFIRAGQVMSVVGIPGIILSVVLASIDLALPLLVGGLLTLAMMVFMIVFMPETGFHPTPAADRSTFQAMTGTFRDGAKVIRARPMLLSILGIGLFYGLYSEAWDRLWQLHLIDSIGLPQFSPVVWFGAIDLALIPISLVASEVLRRRVNIDDDTQGTRALTWITGAMIAGLVLYALTNSLIVALVALAVFSVARGLTFPVYGAWSNRHIDSSVRATVLSVQSQMDAIGQIVGGPPLGAIGQLSLRAAFLASATILSPTLFLLRRVRRHTPDVAPAEAA